MLLKEIYKQQKGEEKTYAATAWWSYGTEQNRTEHNRTEQNTTEQNTTQQNRTQQNRTQQNMKEEALNRTLWKIRFRMFYECTCSEWRLRD
jgi:hypothetical protein